MTENSFVRNCILTFPLLLTLILNLFRKSNAAEIDDSCSFCDKIKRFSKSAFSKARLKLKSGVFIFLNIVVVQEFYKLGTGRKKHFKLNVFAIDGFDVQLPESEEIRSVYGCSSNQNGSNMQLIQVSLWLMLKKDC
jgi:hypothetical protein